MEYRSSKDGDAEGIGGRVEETKSESEKTYFGCGNDAEEVDYSGQSQTKTGAVAPKPSDVRNGDLVSLLLAATPPYLYNIPLVPQTFFFSEMLKSFVQAKTERQNLKAHQAHHRRQRKRSWREATPPNQGAAVDVRDKPLELTTPKHSEDKPKRDKSPAGKKLQQNGADKKISDLGSFSVENLANSSIVDAASASAAPSDLLPPPLPPPLWHPLLYPPHPPLGIDPLHFFIDLRVSAHFSTEDFSDAAPGNFHHASRHCSAFRVPSPRKNSPPPTERSGKSRSVHYVISSLREIYRSLEKEAREREKEEEREKEKEEEEEEEGEGKGEEEEQDEEDEREEERKGGKKCKDLRALIGLELVVDYVKQESDGEEEDKQEETTAAEEGYEMDAIQIEQ